MSMLGADGGFWGGGGPPSITFTDSTSSSTGASSYTFSSLNIGTAASGRDVIVCVDGIGGASAPLVNSVTVGGSSLTEIVERTTTTNRASTTAIYKGGIPSGTTADIVVTFASATIFGCGIVVFSATGIASAATDTQTAIASGASINVSLTVPSGGVAFGVSSTNAAGGGFVSWTNLTEAADFNIATNDAMSAASSTTASGSVSITATFVTISSDSATMCCASFAPA
jgi:hypothetical protein